MPSRLSRWWQHVQGKDDNSTQHSSPSKRRPQSEVLVLPAFVNGQPGELTGPHGSDRSRRRQSSYHRQSQLLSDLQDVQPVSFWKKDSDDDTPVSQQEDSPTLPSDESPPVRSMNDSDGGDAQGRREQSGHSPRNTIQIFDGHEVDVPDRASSLRFRSSESPLVGSPQSPHRIPRKSIGEGRSYPLDPESPTNTNKRPAHPSTEVPPGNAAVSVADTAHVPSRQIDHVSRQHHPDAAADASSGYQREDGVRSQNSGESYAAVPALVADNLSSSSEESVDRTIDHEGDLPSFVSLPIRGVDTTVEKTWMPAVTHDVVDQHFHEIREEHITRDIHNYDVYHRVLPIIDIQVLPARHFVLNEDGTKREISESEIPGRTGPYQDWAIVERVTRAAEDQLRGPRPFTARRFEGNEGDYKEYVTAEGVPRSETTWIHPPEIEQGGRLTGQTEELAHC